MTIQTQINKAISWRYQCYEEKTIRVWARGLLGITLMVMTTREGFSERGTPKLDLSDKDLGEEFQVYGTVMAETERNEHTWSI